MMPCPALPPSAASTEQPQQCDRHVTWDIRRRVTCRRLDVMQNKAGHWPLSRLSTSLRPQSMGRREWNSPKPLTAKVLWRHPLPLVFGRPEGHTHVRQAANRATECLSQCGHAAHNKQTRSCATRHLATDSRGKMGGNGGNGGEWVIWGELNGNTVKTEGHQTMLCRCESILATKPCAVLGFRANTEVIVLIPVQLLS